MIRTVIPDAVCLVICTVAAVTDIKRYRIPNWLTFSGIGCGLLLNTLLVDNGWIQALAGGLTAGVVFGILGAARFVGMGDVKLMMAVGTLLGMPMTFYALVYVGLAGGLVALVYSIARQQVSSVLTNLGRLARGAVERGSEEQKMGLHRIPYGVAILIGSAATIAARYFPLLRF